MNANTGKGARPRVEEAVIEGTGHFCPMERPDLIAEKAGEWIGREFKLWEANDKGWKCMGRDEKEKRAGEWIAVLKSKL